MCSKLSITDLLLRNSSVSRTYLNGRDFTLNSKTIYRHIRRWCLERFDEDEVKLGYQNALKAEVHGFSESVNSKLEGGMKGYDLVNEIVMEWKNVVNRVAKSEVGEKIIDCGRAARWWDNEIK